MKTKDWLKVAFVAAGGYLLYRLWQGASAAAGVIAEPIAKLWVKATSPGLVKIKGALVFPDETNVPLSTVINSAGFKQYWVGDELKMVYNGHTYTISHRDTNGNYIAVL